MEHRRRELANRTKFESNDRRDFRNAARAGWHVVFYRAGC
jgi:hypothetical protein